MRTSYQSVGVKATKKIVALLLMGVSLAAVMPVQANDREVHVPIEAGLAYQGTGRTLDDSVKFYFGKQKYPKVLKNFGSYMSNMKTNAFLAADTDACNRAFMSNMLWLEKKAKQLGANAVVNIVSYYKKDEYSSETDYECHAGGIIAGVALKGDFVKIAGK